MNEKKRKSKNKKNNRNNNQINNQKRTIPGYRFFSTVGALGALGASGYYLWNRAGNKITNIDECKKYKIGDEYDQYISNKTEVDYCYNNPKKILRKGCTYANAIINDYLYPHEDATFIDLNFDILPMMNGDKYNFQGEEGVRYNKCSNYGSHNYRISKNDFDKSIETREYAMRNGKQGYIPTYTPKEIDKKRILSNYYNDIDKAINCSKNNPNVNTIVVKYVNHRTPKGKYQFGIVPGDFKDKFAEMMSLNKNIYIQEFSCFYGEDFPKMIMDLLKKHPNYKGNFILERNSYYNKDLQGYKESGQFQNQYGKRFFAFNELLQDGEYLVFNNKGMKCITENEARKILGGSYKKYNLAYNHYYKIGDDLPTKQCNNTIERYKKYFGLANNVNKKQMKKCNSKFDVYQTCDKLINGESINKSSQSSGFTSDIE